MNKRVQWIDILRGMSMYLVVLGHTSIRKRLQKIIYSFHMPLFFLISGLVFKPNLHLSMKDVIIKKFKAYIIPYFYMHILALPLWIINFKMLRSANPDLMELIFGALVSNNQIFQATTNATWFLTTLFLVDIFFCYIYRLFKDKPVLLFAVVSCFASLSFIENEMLGDFSWVWHFDVVPVGVSLYYLGYMFKQYYDNHEDCFSVKHCIIYTIIFLIVGLYFENKQTRVSMTVNHLGDPILFYIVSLSFSFVMLCLSIIFKRNRLTKNIYDIISYVGKNTLLYIGIQIPIIRLLEGIFPFCNEGNKTIFYILLAILVYLMILPINQFICKYFPFILGKKQANGKSRNIVQFTTMFSFVIISLLLVFINYKNLI